MEHGRCFRAGRGGVARAVEPLEPRTLLAMTPVGPEFPLTEMQGEFPDVGMDADGDAVVVWQEFDGESWNVYAQLVGDDGQPDGEPFLVHAPSSIDQERPSVAVDADGDFAVVWQEEDDDARDGYRMFVRKFDASGAAIMPPTPVNSADPGDEEDASIAMDADGDFVVAWRRTRGGPDSPTEGVWARVFGADGVPKNSEFRIASAFRRACQALRCGGGANRR